MKIEKRMKEQEEEEEDGKEGKKPEKRNPFGTKVQKNCELRDRK